MIKHKILVDLVRRLIYDQCRGEYTKYMYLLRLDVLMFQLIEHDTVIKTDKNPCIICQTSGEKRLAQRIKEKIQNYKYIHMEPEIPMVHRNKKIESTLDPLHCFTFDFKSRAILIWIWIKIWFEIIWIKMGNKGKKYIENVVCYLCGFCMRSVHSKLQH